MKGQRSMSFDSASTRFASRMLRPLSRADYLRSGETGGLHNATTGFILATWHALSRFGEMALLPA